MRRINQFGFTLFEITFVIVMMLLLAALIVMGQHMTNDLKVNRLDHDLHSIQAAIYDSQDRSRQTNSNFRKASSRSLVSVAFGNDGSWNSIVGESWQSTSGETFSLWLNVRPAGAAGEATGRDSNAYVPLRSSGDITDLSRTSAAPIAGLKGDYIICTDNIAGGLVRQLDLEMDDGNTASGAMRMSNVFGGTGITADGIDDDSAYMVCLGV
jgi:hypothetical protein